MNQAPQMPSEIPSPNSLKGRVTPVNFESRISASQTTPPPAPKKKPKLKSLSPKPRNIFLEPHRFKSRPKASETRRKIYSITYRGQPPKNKNGAAGTKKTKPMHSICAPTKSVSNQPISFTQHSHTVHTTSKHIKIWRNTTNKNTVRPSANPTMYTPNEWKGCYSSIPKPFRKRLPVESDTSIT